MRVGIVGAGVTGLSLAFFLAEAGVETVVFERTGIGAGASGVQPGGVRQQWSTRANCLLARESVAFYRTLAERLGRPVEARLEACGYLFLAHSDEALTGLRDNVAVQNAAGVPSRIVSPSEAAELVPGLEQGAVAGAAWCGEDGYFDRPQTVVEAFAAAAADRGSRVEIAEVRRLSRDGGGWRLELRDGSATVDGVVVAAGCETPALLAALATGLPIVPEQRHLFLSEPIGERLLEPLVVSSERRFAAKQLASGRVLASDLDATGDAERLREAWRKNVAAAVHELLPILTHVSYPLLVGGPYDTTPDHQPVLGQVGDALWVAAGFSGHGFMLAPAISRRLAAEVADGPIDELLDAFRPGRFEGGRLEAEHQLV
jgi:sarcosine oxidase subunit beta